MEGRHLSVHLLGREKHMAVRHLEKGRRSQAGKARRSVRVQTDTIDAELRQCGRRQLELAGPGRPDEYFCQREPTGLQRGCASCLEEDLGPGMMGVVSVEVGDQNRCADDDQSGHS